MELAKQIDVAPKNGDFIILQHACSSELGRWAQEANGWVQAGGTPVRISRWTWLPYDVSDATDHEHLLPLTSPLPDDETEQKPKRPLARLILAFVIAIFCIGGFVFWIASEDSSSDDSAAGLQREFSRERDPASVAIGGLTAARERENVALTETLESTRIANSKQRELKQALDESEKKALPLNRELTSARETIASAEKPSSAEVTARDATAPTGPLDRPMEQSNASSEITSSMTTLQSSGEVTAGVQASSDATPDDATAGASGRLMRSTRSESSRPQPPSTMSSAEEVKLHFPWSIGGDLRADSTDILG